MLSGLGFVAAALRQWRRWTAGRSRAAGRAHWLRNYLRVFGLTLAASTLLLVWMVGNERYQEDFEFGVLLVFGAFTLVLAHQSIRRSAYSGWLTDRSRPAPATGYAALREVMERERPYLRPTLKLGELATAAGLPPQEVTTLINGQGHNGFYGFVNAYRLRDFERRLRQPDARQYTIEALGRECGFSSRTVL